MTNEFNRKFDGPFKFTGRISPVSYRVRACFEKQQEDTVYVWRIKKFCLRQNNSIEQGTTSPEKKNLAIDILDEAELEKRKHEAI